MLIEGLVVRFGNLTILVMRMPAIVISCHCYGSIAKSSFFGQNALKPLGKTINSRIHILLKLTNMVQQYIRCKRNPT